MQSNLLLVFNITTRVTSNPACSFQAIAIRSYSVVSAHPADPNTAESSSSDLETHSLPLGPNAVNARRRKTPWKHKPSRRDFFEALALSKGFRLRSEWYTLTKRDVVDFGGSGLLRHYYKGSVAAAIADLFPEHKWESWRFSRSPRNIWMDPDTARQFFESISPLLGVSTMDDWYRISSVDVIKHGGETLLCSFKSLAEALQHACAGSQRPFCRQCLLTER